MYLASNSLSRITVASIAIEQEIKSGLIKQIRQLYTTRINNITWLTIGHGIYLSLKIELNAKSVYLSILLDTICSRLLKSVAWKDVMSLPPIIIPKGD
jgi:hypothetical protein